MRKNKYDHTDTDIILEAYNYNDDEVIIKCVKDGKAFKTSAIISSQAKFDKIVIKYLNGYYYDFIDGISDKAQQILSNILHIDSVYDIESIPDNKVEQALSKIVNKGIPVFEFQYNTLLEHGTTYFIDYMHLLFIRKNIYEKLPNDVKNMNAEKLYDSNETYNLFV